MSSASAVLGTNGRLWRYTAIDAASSYVWAELHAAARTPSAKWTSAPARRVAYDLRQRNWQLKAISGDNGRGFVADDFTHRDRGAKAQHRRIKALSELVPVPANPNSPARASGKISS